MTLKPRTIGLALAVILLCAAAASSAQASNPGKVTSLEGSYPLILEGNGNTTNRFTLAGLEFTCHSSYAGEVSAASESITLQANYSQCHVPMGVFLGTVPFTTTMNGCAFILEDFTTSAESEGAKHFYTSQTSIQCPEKAKIETHIYQNPTTHSEGKSLCTLTIGPQTLNGPNVTVDTEEGTLSLTGTISNVHIEQHRNSFFCPEGTTATTGVFHIVAGDATPKITSSSYPLKLDATGNSGTKITAFGHEVTCTKSSFSGEVTAAATSFELTPSFSECHTVVPFLGTARTTVTHNGCKYRFDLSETGTTAGVVCPPEEKIEIHIYFDEKTHSENKALCTLTIGPQSGLPSPIIDNPGKGDVLMTGAISALHVEQHSNSPACPEGTTTSNGAQDMASVGLTVTGTTAGGSPLSFDIGSAGGTMTLRGTTGAGAPNPAHIG
jgi:hypothetical protein